MTKRAQELRVLLTRGRCRNEAALGILVGVGAQTNQVVGTRFQNTPDNIIERREEGGRREG